MTRAPKLFASMIAVVPMPDEPPWIRMVSPGCSAPRSNTLCQTVKKVSGIAAASTIVSCGITGSGRALVRHPIFRVAAAGHERADRVADLPALHVRAERHDLAGKLQSRNVGRAGRRRVMALTLHHVRTVDARGRDLDQHLAGSGRRHRAFLGHQHVGRAGRGDCDRGHAGRGSDVIGCVSVSEGFSDRLVGGGRCDNVWCRD